MSKLHVTSPAEADLDAIYQWWAANRSSEQASRWYASIVRAIDSLKREAARHPLATENHLVPTGVRELSFGLGRRPTHRVLFTIDDDTVIVLRVQHVSQDTLSADELVDL